MRELKIYAARSCPLSGTELRGIVERIAARDCKGDIETYASPQVHACSMRLDNLPVLNAFQSISSTFGVMLITQAESAEYAATVESFTRRTHNLSLSHAWTTWYVCEGARAIACKREDLGISAGLRKEGYFAGIQLFQLSDARLVIEQRRELFDQAIAAMGISESIVTQIGDDVLYMKNELPWKLVYPSHQVPGGGNPSGFYACGFSGIEDALAAGQRLVERFAKKILRVSFVCVLTGEGYNTVFRELSAEWHLWDITVMGTLTPEAISILRGGEISEDAPARIPAFTWYCDRDCTVYGSVVIENGERYLEIATDDGTLEMLQERVAFLHDIQFHAVFP